MKKKIISLLMALVMVVSLMPTSILAADDTVKSATVKVRAQQGTEFLYTSDTLTVSSDEAEKYGFDDQVASTESVSALDVLVAAHVDKYGAAFTTETASSYLTMSYGNPAAMFGNGNTSLYSGFAVNHDYAKDSAGNGYNVNACPIADGDVVDFFYYEDSYWGDTISAFTDAGGSLVDEITIEAGTATTLGLSGFMFMSGYATHSFSALYSEEGALSVYSKDLTKSYADVTAENGQFQVTFDTPGVYYLTAMGYESTDFRVVMPYLKVTVTGDIQVSVSMSNQGVLATDKNGNAAANETVTLTGKAAYTIDDALKAFHDAYYEGGSEAGYGSATTSYGLSVTKLWGDTSGAFGYYVNNNSAWSLADPVVDGDTVSAFIYKDQTYWSDSYAYFTSTTASTVTGEDLNLTLNCMSYDASWNLVPGVCAGAAVLIDGEDSGKTTDASGNVTLNFTQPGTYVVSAKCDSPLITAPACIVTVTEDIQVSVSMSNQGILALDKNDEEAANKTVTLTGKSAYTIDDALKAFHDAYYEGGSEAGYGSATTSYGLSVTKLWGDTSGAFGYYVNNNSAWSLADPVVNGDTVSAFIYKDQTYWSDSYAYFTSTTAAASTGEDLNLTLNCMSYDASWNLVPGVCAGATILVDGKDSGKTTDADGKVSLNFTQPGTYVVSAQCDSPLITSAACTVTVTGDSKGTLLSALAFGPSTSATNKGVYSVEAIPSLNRYTVYVDDTRSAIAVWATADGATISAAWTNTSGTAKTQSITSGKTTGQNLLSCIKADGKGNTITLTVTKGTTVETYTIHVVRTDPTLTALTCEETAFNETFATATKDYTLVTDASTIHLTATPKDTSYTVTYNGASSGEIALTDGENDITVKLTNASGYETTYTVKATKTEPVAITINATPADAVISVKDHLGNVVEASADGTYAILKDTEYTYVVTKSGYVTGKATKTATAAETINVTLEEAPAGTTDSSVTSAWWNFRNSDTNMAVTDISTPKSAEGSELLWAKSFGSSWSAAPSVQLIADDAVFCMSGTTLYKLDLTTGEVLGSATLAQSAGYGYTPMTYADGMIFCPEAKGTVQAFDAKTLASLWVYTDALGGQSLSPLTYADGYLYTGFWNSEVKDANYVCISVTDEDPTQTNEAKEASWTRTVTGGFYWAGSVVVGDAVIVGTDDGASGATGDSHLYALNCRTGKVISDITLTGMGDQRSSLAYSAEQGRIYFTTMGGYLASVAVNSTTGAISDLKSVDVGESSTSTPVVYGDKVYFGTGNTFTAGNFVVADAGTLNVLYKVALKGQVKSSMLLSTAYYEAEGKLYFYCTYNNNPGGISLIKVDPTVNTADGAQLVELYSAEGYEQYCITSVICGEDGTLYYKNDSGNILAVAVKKCAEHTYGSWIVTKTATAISEGSEYRICSVCGNKDVQTIAKLTVQQIVDAADKEAPTAPTGSVTTVTPAVSSTADTVAAEEDFLTDVITSVISGETPEGVKEVSDGAIYQALANGETLSIATYINVVDASNVSASDAEAIAEKAGDATIEMYLNVGMTISGSASGKLADVTEPGQNVTFSLTLTNDMAASLKNKKIAIVRIHDGVTDLLDATLTGNVVTFTTDRFSTYALISTENSTVKTGESNVVIYLGAAAIVSAAGVMVLLLNRKRVH